VIASNENNIDSRVTKIGERRQRAKMRSRDHRFPLEPEIEEIPVYEERVGTSGETPEKSH